MKKIKKRKDRAFRKVTKDNRTITAVLLGDYFMCFEENDCVEEGKIDNQKEIANILIQEGMTEIFSQKDKLRFLKSILNTLKRKKYEIWG